MTHFIYRLLGPDKIPFYVGKAYNPYRRLKEHFCSLTSAPASRLIYKKRWNAKHLSIIIVAACAKHNKSAERNEVQKCLREGHPILNVHYRYPRPRKRRKRRPSLSVTADSTRSVA